MAKSDSSDAPLVRLEEQDGVAHLIFNAPPVNAISPAVTAGLREALDVFDASDAIGLVIRAEGRTFVAGGDIAVFDDPDFSTKPFNTLLDRIEASARPVVACLHGTTLGGGLELAMACHARVAHPETKLGLPEIMLGLFPGSLGTQRTPRLIGLAKTAEMVLSGSPVSAQAALDMGLVDRISADGVADSVALVRELSGQPPRRTRDLPIPDLDRADDILTPLEQAAADMPHLPARAAALDALRASTRGYAEGEATEAARFLDIVHGETSRAMRHVFFAERRAQKVRDLPADTGQRPVETVGILGAGTMGTGIAMAFANAGFPVTLVDVNPDTLSRALGMVQSTNAKMAERGRITPEVAQERTARIVAAPDIAALAQVDLVVEAVFENMALKLDVMGQLGRICKPGAILATNTSTLDVDRIAEASGRAGDVVGTHFFSPAQIMRLLEVVRGKATAPDVLATVMAVARRIRKTAVVTGVCYGFVGNRMAEVYMRESEAMQLEGATAGQIDGVAEDPRWLGMAMGPSRMLDMAGVDVGARTVIEWIDSGEGPQDPAYRVLCRCGHGAGLRPDRQRRKGGRSG